MPPFRYLEIMVDIRPFRAVLFHPSRVCLGRALCPPYDVIPPVLRRRLSRRPINAIHLELPEGNGDEKYRRALRLWRRWLRLGILRREEREAFYVCEQSFLWNGRRMRRWGILAALNLRQSRSDVLPHEKTFAGPKRDRLKLLEILRVNTSPVFGVYSDPRGNLLRWIRDRGRNRPVLAGKDSSGVRYRLWRVCSVPEAVRIRRSFNPKRILLADGHHRYRVACRYAARRPEAGRILIYVCAEEDPGTLILPTHRIVKDGAAVSRRLDKLCRVRPRRSLRDVESFLKRERAPAAFGYFDGSLGVAVPRLVAQRSCLGVEWVRRHILRGILPGRICYSWDSRQALRSARRMGGAAIFLKGITAAQVRRSVGSGRLLPQKSTFFYPKIAAGLVFKEVC